MIQLHCGELPEHGGMMPSITFYVYDSDAAATGGDAAGHNGAKEHDPCVASLRVTAVDAGFAGASGGLVGAPPAWFDLRPLRGAAAHGGGGGQHGCGEILLAFELVERSTVDVGVLEAAAASSASGAATAAAMPHPQSPFVDYESRPALVEVAVFGARDLRAPTALHGRTAERFPRWPRVEVRVQRSGRAAGGARADDAARASTRSERNPAPCDPNYVQRLLLPPVNKGEGALALTSGGTGGTGGDNAAPPPPLMLPLDPRLAPMLEVRVFDRGGEAPSALASLDVLSGGTGGTGGGVGGSGRGGVVVAEAEAPPPPSAHESAGGQERLLGFGSVALADYYASAVGLEVENDIHNS